MRLSKDNIILVLSKNFGFEKVKDERLGELIKVGPFEGYIYSTITGHGYLDNPTNPFTPNGLMGVFNQANAYNLVTGLFDRDGNLFHTPLLQAREKPFLLRGEKYILPVEYNTSTDLNAQLQEIYQHLIESKREPHDFIICRIKKSTNGYAMEPFMEYVASKYFQRQGYFTETQIPFYYSGGTPDFASYSLPDIQRALTESFDFIGASFIGLASIRAFGFHQDGKATEHDRTAIVGEVKTASLDALTQIKKYLRQGVFNKAYEIIPHKKSPEVIAGLLTLNESGLIQLYEAKTPAVIEPKKQEEYLGWLNNYIKYFLVANLENEELDEFYSRRVGKRTRTIPELLEFVNALPLEELVAKLKSYLHGK